MVKCDINSFSEIIILRLIEMLLEYDWKVEKELTIKTTSCLLALSVGSIASVLKWTLKIIQIKWFNSSTSTIVL